MILYNIFQNEAHPEYKKLAASNGVRHYDFLKSIVEAAIGSQQVHLSGTIVKALNFHAIACLHTDAGQWRSGKVYMSSEEGLKDMFPEPWQLPDMMDQFINEVNRLWLGADPLTLGAYVLWRLNRIHPFFNGNGRTARAACYYVICLKLGGWLPYSTILPEMIVENRPEYIEILKRVDASHALGTLDLSELAAFLDRLLQEIHDRDQPGEAPPAQP